MRPGLERIEALLDALGQPEQALPHRPGRRHQRQGLGRRACSPPILQAAGRRVGPLHLAASRSRTASASGWTAGRSPRTTSWTAWTRSARSRAGSTPPSSRRPPRSRSTTSPRGRVEVAVLEVGLGGRLDATTVGQPARGRARRRIDYDHQARPRRHARRRSPARRRRSSGAAWRCSAAPGARGRGGHRGARRGGRGAAPRWRAASCASTAARASPRRASGSTCAGPGWRIDDVACAAARASTSRATPCSRSAAGARAGRGRGARSARAARACAGRAASRSSGARPARSSSTAPTTRRAPGRWPRRSRAYFPGAPVTLRARRPRRQGRGRASSPPLAPLAAPRRSSPPPRIPRAAAAGRAAGPAAARAARGGRRRRSPPTRSPWPPRRIRDGDRLRGRLAAR